MSQVESAVFVQTDIKLSDKVLISPGVRYQLQTHLQDRNNLDPRVSLSYQLNKTTIVRLGAGTFHQPFSVLDTAGMDRAPSPALRLYRDRRQCVVRTLDQVHRDRGRQRAIVRSHPIWNRCHRGLLADRSDWRAGRLLAVSAGARNAYRFVALPRSEIVHSKFAAANDA